MKTFESLAGEGEIARMHTTESDAKGGESKEDVHASSKVVRYEDGVFSDRQDSVIQEMQLRVFVDGHPCFVSTCSPWDIEELVVGRLMFEGAVKEVSSIEDIQIDVARARIDVKVSLRVGWDGRRMRSTREDVQAARQALGSEKVRIMPAVVTASIEELEDRSLLFHKTGGVHSAVLADSRGRTLARFEDIGRHNALDKLAGWCALNDVDTSSCIFLFSGRVPYEIITRLAALSCALVISPSAPTSLSIEIAERNGITLIGFARNGRFNVYSHPERIVGCLP